MISQLIDKLCVILATGFGVGYSKKAPGTLGSLIGIPLGILVSSNSMVFTDHLFAVLVLIFLGFIITVRAERVFNIHDDQRIVIDEIVGQALTIAFFEPSWIVVLVGFGLFRLFDIWKPGPIGYIDEHLPGAWGTFFDDILAGIFALGILYLFIRTGF